MALPVWRRAFSNPKGTKNTIAIGKPPIKSGDVRTDQPIDEDHAEVRRAACADADCCAQTLRKTSVPLVPPKPKEFDTATSIFIGRAVLGT